MPEGYKGKTKAEVRAMVLANNKGKKASNKSRQSMNTELKLWSLQNRDLEVKPKPKAKPVVVEEEAVYSNYGSSVGNKLLARDETYNDYAQAIRSGAQGSGEGDPEGLYKEPPIQKKVSRGYKMPGYGKRK